LADVDPASTVRPTLEITQYDREGAERLLKLERIESGFVALAPGSIWGSKQWPYFPALAQAVAQHGAAVVAVGSRDEAPLGDAVAQAARQAGGTGASACGRLSLRESAALIGKAAVLVTNDSAPLHLAQAVGTPTVALFGPTVPAFGFGPRGERDAALGVDDLPCRPCHPHGPRACPLGHHRCMRELRVEQVLDALEAIGALRRRN
jgi:heptosyltransferase-2